MAETFGEADVILRARLDQLQKDLDQSEQLVEQSTGRVADAQQEAMAQVSAAGHEAGATWADVAMRLISAVSIITMLREGIKFAAIGMRTLAAASTAAAVAIAAIPVTILTATALAAGMIGDMNLRAARTAREVVRAFGELDGSTQKVRELHDELARIPVVGGLVSQVGKMISSDQTIRTEGWARLVSTVEDGEVKVNMLGRAINGLVNISGPGVVARLLGFDTDLVGDIEKVNASIREMRMLTAVQERGQAIGEQVAGPAADAARQAARDAELASLDGIERIQAAERQRHEDVQRFFDERVKLANEAYSAERQGIMDLADENEWSYRQRALAINTLAREQSRNLENLERARNAAEADSQRAAETRIRLAREEAAEQAKVTAEVERVNRLRRESAVVSLTASADAAEFESSGDTFEADRIRLQADRQRALLELEISGNMDLLDETNRYYDARRDLIDTREKQEQEQREQAMLETNEQLRSRIMQARLTSEGREVEAKQEEIRQRFQEMIDRLESAGNAAGADAARSLRDLEIANAGREREQDRVQQIGEFRQVQMARISLGGPGNDDKQIERDQLQVLKSIDGKTKRDSIARAG